MRFADLFQEAAARLKEEKLNHAATLAAKHRAWQEGFDQSLQVSACRLDLLRRRKQRLAKVLAASDFAPAG